MLSLADLQAVSQGTLGVRAALNRAAKPTAPTAPPRNHKRTGERRGCPRGKSSRSSSGPSLLTLCEERADLIAARALGFLDTALLARLDQIESALADPRNATHFASCDSSETGSAARGWKIKPLVAPGCGELPRHRKPHGPALHSPLPMSYPSDRSFDGREARRALQGRLCEFAPSDPSPSDPIPVRVYSTLPSVSATPERFPGQFDRRGALLPLPANWRSAGDNATMGEVTAKLAFLESGQLETGMSTLPNGIEVFDPVADRLESLLREVRPSDKAIVRMVAVTG